MDLLRRHYTSAAAALLAGCALLPTQQAPNPPLLAPGSLGQTRSAAQVLHAAFGEHKFDLQCALAADPQQISLIAIGPLGRRVFSVRYDGARVLSQGSAEAPPGLVPERVLADVELALWPLAAWQARLDGSDWQLSEPRPGLRRLLYRGRLMEEVRYAAADPWTAPLWLTSFEPAYTLEIDPQI